MFGIIAAWAAGEYLDITQNTNLMVFTIVNAYAYRIGAVSASFSGSLNETYDWQF